MKTTTYLVALVFALAVTRYVVPVAGNATTESARVGEVREFAVAPGNTQVIAQLHRDGWLEARGQLLSAQAYPALYGVVGRTWTTEEVVGGRFALPDLRDRSQRSLSSDNPFGVLGPGDVVTSGGTSRQWLRASPITYWIFTGSDMTRLEAFSSAR